MNQAAQSEYNSLLRAYAVVFLSKRNTHLAILNFHPFQIIPIPFLKFSTKH